MKHQIATAVAALLFVLAARVLGGDQQAPAVLGASIAGATAIVSILGLGWAFQTRNPTQGALLVMGVLFLVRIVLVGAGTLLVGRAGAVPYVIAFFVPYFTFAGLEGAYVHSLRRSDSAA